MCKEDFLRIMSKFLTSHQTLFKLETLLGVYGEIPLFDFLLGADEISFFLLKPNISISSKVYGIYVETFWLIGSDCQVIYFLNDEKTITVSNYSDFYDFWVCKNKNFPLKYKRVEEEDNGLADF